MITLPRLARLPCLGLAISLSVMAIASAAHAGVCERLKSTERRVDELRDEVNDLEMRTDELGARLQEAKAATGGVPSNAAAIQQAQADRDYAEQQLATAVREQQITVDQADPGQVTRATAAVDAAKQAREAARLEFERADALRTRLDSQEPVRKSRERIAGLESSIGGTIGRGVDLTAPADVVARLDGGWQGSQHSRLWAAYRILERASGQSDPITLSSGDAIDPQNQVDSVSKAKKRIDDYVGKTSRELRELRNARIEFESAKRKAGQGLSDAQREALRTIDALERKAQDAARAVEAAEEELRNEKSDVERARGKLAERQQEVDRLTAERDAARATLTAEKAKKSPDEIRAEELERELEAADVEYFDKQWRLADAETRLDELRTQLTQVEAEIDAYYAQGKGLGSQAVAAKKAGDDALCLQHLGAARQQFSAAYSLAQANVACLSVLEAKGKAIGGRLDQVERMPCGSDRLDSEPRDGLVAVPSVSNVPLPDARRLLESAGLTVAPVENFAPPARDAAGIVNQQDPGPGERVEAGSTITVWHYGELREVPPVKGMNVEVADGALAENGLFGQRFEGKPAPLPQDVGNVYDQSPDAGTRVLPGESVRIEFYAAVSGSGGAAGSGNGSGSSGGFSRSGGVTTVSSTPTGSPGSGGSSGSSGSGGAPAAPDPARDAAIARIQDAWTQCDLTRALVLADQFAAKTGADPWIAANYGRLAREARTRDAAENMLRQARVALSKSDPTDADVRSATALVTQAQSMAPACMSQTISSLGPQISSVQTAVAAANAAERRAASGRLLGALSGVISTVAAATGRLPSGINIPTSLDPTDIGAAATTLLGDALGSATGSAGAGATPAPASSAGGAPPAASCDGCVILDYVKLGSQGRLNYVIGIRAEAPAPSCAGGRARIGAYYLLPVSPEDDEGRPMSTWPQVNNLLRATPNSHKVCGPCGNYAQAAAAMRRACPNPVADTSGFQRMMPDLRSFTGGR